MTAPIGGGDIGQIWQAHGTEVNRDVALKILRDVFAADLDRLARFQYTLQTDLQSP